MGLVCNVKEVVIWILITFTTLVPTALPQRRYIPPGGHPCEVGGLYCCTVLHPYTQPCMGMYSVWRCRKIDTPDLKKEVAKGN